MHPNFTVATFESGYQMISVRCPYKFGWNNGKFNLNTYKAIFDARILPFMNNVHGGLTSYILQKDTR